MKLPTYSFTLLQQEELHKAEQAGLSPEQLTLLKTHHLNYLQMKEIRQAMQENLDPVLIQTAVKRNWPAYDMQDCFQQLRSGQSPDLSCYERRHRLPWHAAVLPFLGLLVFCLCSGLLHLPGKPVLELKSTEAYLSVGQQFEPMTYVARAEGEGRLLLPEAFVAEVPETRLVRYELITETGHLQVLLRVFIRDDTPPVLTLKESEVTLSGGEAFACLAYLQEASDNIDGDLRYQTSCSYEDGPSFTVTYEVSDSAGNRSTASLQVLRIAPPEEASAEPEPEG